mgnify:CR=1 FL=1
MLNTDAKSIKEQGDALFAAKGPWDTRNQDIADNFYVERADFTITRDIGDDYADHLMSGYPAMVRRDLGNSRATVTNTGDRLIVTMPQDILFATDSASVRSDLQRDLRVVASNLQAYPNSTVQVIGHTDNVGDASYNQDLSTHRGNAVANILVDSGIPYSRIQSFGRGEDQPLASNLSAEGRSQNRRVEIYCIR